MHATKEQNIRRIADFRPVFRHCGPSLGSIDVVLVGLDAVGKHEPGAAVPGPTAGCFIRRSIVPGAAGFPDQPAPEFEVNALLPARSSQAVAVQLAARTQNRRYAEA